MGCCVSSSAAKARAAAPVRKKEKKQKKEKQKEQIPAGPAMPASPPAAGVRQAQLQTTNAAPAADSAKKSPTDDAQARAGSPLGPQTPSGAAAAVSCSAVCAASVAPIAASNGSSAVAANAKPSGILASAAHAAAPAQAPAARAAPKKSPFGAHSAARGRAGLAWVCGADELKKLNALEDASSVAQLAGLCGLLREASAAAARGRAGSGPDVDAPLRLALELPLVRRQYGGDVTKALEATKEACRAAVEVFAEQTLDSPAALADVCAVVLSGDAELSRSLLDVLLSLGRSTVLARVPPARVGALADVLGRLPRGTLTSTDRARLVEFCIEQLKGVTAASPGDVDALSYLRLVPAVLAAVEARGDGAGFDSDAPAVDYEGTVRELDALLKGFERCGWWRAEAAASFARQALAAARSDYDPLQDALGRAKAFGRVVHKLYRAGKVVLEGVSSFGVTTAIDLAVKAKEVLDGGELVDDLREFWADFRLILGVGGPQKKKCWYRVARLLAALAEGGHLAELEAELEAGALADAAGHPKAAAALCAALFSVRAARRASRLESVRRSAPALWKADVLGVVASALANLAALNGCGNAAAAAAAVAALQRMWATGGAAQRASDAAACKFLGVPSAENAVPVPRFPKALGAAGAPRGSSALVRDTIARLARDAPDRSLCEAVLKYARGELGDEDAAQALALYVPPKATADVARRVVVDLFGHVAAFLRRRLPARGTAPAVPASGAAAGAGRVWAEARGRPPAGEGGLPVTCLLRLSNLSRERAAGGLRAEAARALGLPEADLPALRESRGLVLLLDAYDELECGGGRPPALWTAGGGGNELGKWASAAVVTCRSAYLAAQSDYPSLFAAAGEPLEEVCTHPFDAGQVEDYIGQYIRARGPGAPEGKRDPDCTWTVEEYVARIAQVPGTAALIENPFTLSMVVESLPRILKSRQEELFRTRGGSVKVASKYFLTIRELYQKFVERWFRQQWNKSTTAAAKENGLLRDWEVDDFQDYCLEFCKDLATSMFKANVSEVLCPQKKPKSAKYIPMSIGLEATATATGPDAAPSSAAPATATAQRSPSSADLERCVKLLSDATDPVRVFCRENCPMRVSKARDVDGGTAARFLHKTLLEYFVAEGAYADGSDAFRSAIEREARSRPRARLQSVYLVQSIGASGAASMRAEPSLLHLRLLTKEPKIVQFLADHCTADVNYRNELLRLIKKSRRADATPGDITASANAITILNRAGFSFAGSQLWGIRVPGADLQRMEAAGADLRGADLTGSTLLEANLCGADLRGSVLTGCSVTLHPAFHGHTKSVNAVAVTPDGKRAVSGADDKTLRVWDLESGAEMRRLEGHDGDVWSVAISSDGTRAVSGSEDKTVRVWDLDSGAELRVLAGHIDDVHAVAISPPKRTKRGRLNELEASVFRSPSAGPRCPSIASVSRLQDGKRAVSGSLHTLWVWDLETGSELRRLTGHEKDVWSVAITPDGKRAVSGSEDETVRVWDLDSGAELRVLVGHKRSVRAVAISPDGTRVLSGSKDKTLRVWDLESGAELRVITGHEDRVFALAFLPDGKLALSGSGDKTLRLWDLESGAELQCLAGHKSTVNSVAVLPNGKLAVSGSDDKVLRLWNLESGAELRQVTSHEGDVWSVAISPRFKADRGRLRELGPILSFNIFKIIIKLSVFDTARADLRPLCTLQDGKRAVSGSKEGRMLRLWDLETGSELRRLTGHDGDAYCVAVLPDGKRALSGGEDKTLRLWDLESGEELRQLVGHTEYVRSLAVSPDGLRAVSGSADNTLRVWDLESGAELRTLTGHDDTVVSVAVTQDGKRALSGSGDKTLRLWDLESGAELRVITGHEGPVLSVAISPDGRRAVSGSRDWTLRVWDLESGAELRRLKGHKSMASSIAITPDGKYIVTGCDHKTLRVWDLETGVQLRKPRLSASGRTISMLATSLSISPDGRRVVTGSADVDSSLLVWDMQAGVELAGARAEGRGRLQAPAAGGQVKLKVCAVAPDGEEEVVWASASPAASASGHAPSEEGPAAAAEAKSEQLKGYAFSEDALGGRGLLAAARPDGTVSISTLPRVFCARRIGKKRAQEFHGCKFDGATVMSGKLALLLEQEGGVRLGAGEGAPSPPPPLDAEADVRLWLPNPDQ
eukprot:tig00021038_g17553.t1